METFNPDGFVVEVSEGLDKFGVGNGRSRRDLGMFL